MTEHLLELALFFTTTTNPPVGQGLHHSHTLVLVTAASNTIFLPTRHPPKLIKFLDCMEWTFSDNQNESGKLILVGTGLKNLGDERLIGGGGCPRKRRKVGKKVGSLLTKIIKIV